MPRPAITLTTPQRAEVETLAAVLTAQQMADYFGLGRTTFFALLERDPDVAERYKRGKARAIGSIAQSLIAKARGGNVTAMIFYLKTQGGWRETAAVEHTLGEVEDTAGNARDTLARMIDRLAARQRAGRAIEDADCRPGDPS